MTPKTAYENAIDLLDADHKAVRKLFIDYNLMADEAAPGKDRKQLADKICQEIIIHAQIEEEIFYPEVRKALGDDALMDEALQEHAEAKEAIAKIQGMAAGDRKLDESVQQLQKMIEAHVLEEREQIFLRAQYAPMDLRGLAVPLAKRKMALKKKATATTPKKEPA